MPTNIQQFLMRLTLDNFKSSFKKDQQTPNPIFLRCAHKSPFCGFIFMDMTAFGNLQSRSIRGLIMVLSSICDCAARRLGGESDWEIVSCRAVRACVHACVRACARSGCLVDLEQKRGSILFPFPFWGAELSLFPSPHAPNLLSNFSWDYR